MLRRRPTAAAVVTAFFESCQARGLSKATLAWYRYTLAPLHNGPGALPARPEALEKLLAGLPVRSPASRHCYWRAWRTLYSFAEARFGVPNAAAALAAPRLPPQLPRTLALDQAVALLRRRLSRRDRALLTLLLDTGLRIGEAASLSWAQVGQASVVVIGKTGQHEVPISPQTRRLLVGLGKEGDIWTGKKGRLTTSGLGQVARRALRRTGLPGGPQTLRHTFARLYVLNGGDVFSLQRILGHSQISTTRRYVDLDTRDVQRQHALYSPIRALLR